MEDLGFKLKKLRKYKGINQDELAQMLGVGKTTISNYETGYTVPPNTNLRQLANFFGVTLDGLTNDGITIDDLLKKLAPSNGVTPPQEPILRNPPATPFQEMAVPVYMNLTTHCVPVHQFIFSTSFIGEGEFFGLKISGNRMDRAGLSDGSIAIIRSQDFADDNEVVAVALDDNPAFICRYFRQGELVLLESESSNPAYHRPIVVNPKAQTFKILGKVIKSIQSVF